MIATISLCGPLKSMYDLKHNDRVTVGSDSACEFHVTDSRLAAKQFRLVNRGRFCTLHMYNKDTPVFVDGARYDSGRIGNGSQIEVNGVAFWLTISGTSTSRLTSPRFRGADSGVTADHDRGSEDFCFDPGASMGRDDFGVLEREVLRPIRNRNRQ